jgi:hypothetical protein
MAGEDQHREGSTDPGAGTSEGQAASVRNPSNRPDQPTPEELVLPGQSPLFHAQHAPRYQRQELIRYYQSRYDCRLIVVIDVIFGQSIPFLEELLYDADPAKDLHMILDSPGGDGETAVRMIRSAQARCKKLVVIVPDQAKSAATILAMGAHSILMGPSSDLGPVDPQFEIGIEPNARLVSGKDIIAAVEAAEKAVAANPSTYPLHASLLADVTALQVQQARSALARTDDLVEEALRSNPDRTPAEVAALKEKLRRPLIELAKEHGAVFGAQDAVKAGLPVVIVNPQDDQWKLIWRLYAKYMVLGGRVYEGERASQIR